ncbi:MAG: pyridoxamine 5'-phosphate oxidase family protein [Gaiellaceae bacterium]
MYETDDELRRLQQLLDRTLERANPHLTSIVTPERRLTAEQVVAYLQGTKHVAFATVNEQGEPRVAPLDGVFVRGRFTVGTGARAARLRHLRANPACSAVHMDGDVVGIAAHGRAAILEQGDEGVEELDRIWTGIYGSSPFSWGEGVVFMVVEPSSMWAYASHPENFPT